MATDRREVVLVSGVRTAIGEFLGTLAPLTAPQLGAKVIEEAVRRVHRYDVPEILAVPIVAGSGAYLQWLEAELEPPE